MVPLLFVPTLLACGGGVTESREPTPTTSSSAAKPEERSAGGSAQPAATSAPSAQAAKPGPVVHGSDYSLPIPTGWEVAPDVVKDKPGAVAIRVSHKPPPDFFLASIIVTQVLPFPADLDPTDLATCEATAQGIASRFGSVGHGEIGAGPVGRTCHWDITPKNSSSKQAARGTLVKGAKSAWVVTCNHDPRDTDVLRDCEAALAGWKFDG